jgi:hypothetical protein
MHSFCHRIFAGLFGNDGNGKSHIKTVKISSLTVSHGRCEKTGTASCHVFIQSDEERAHSSTDERSLHQFVSVWISTGGNSVLFASSPGIRIWEWALNYHGITPQSQVIYSIITLSPAAGKCRNILYRGVTIEYSKILSALFSGLTRVEDFYIATPEKAVLDTMHLRKTIQAEDELELDNINIAMMNKMAPKFPL